jgi:hypothetical protein
MQSLLKLRFIFLLMPVLFSCNNSSTESTSEPAKDSASQATAAPAPPKAGFFYFELLPTVAAKPYYFSQVVMLTYKDNVDLGRQQDSCMLLLRAQAGNPKDYNQKSSLEHATFKDADDERKDNIRHLRDAGETVMEKTI